MQRIALAAILGSALLAAPPGVLALQPCTQGCARISVGSTEAPPNRLATIPISFQQAPDDGQAGRGPDEVAAVAFTLGIPGDGSGTPLRFDCSNGHLAAGAAALGAGIAGQFDFVIENAACVNRDHCLCPGSGQSRDDYVNIALFGLKDLSQGSAIPALPPSGEILRLRLRLASGLSQNTVIPLHVLAETDGAAFPKPPFTAYLSIGDRAAIDQTANRDTDRSRVSVQDGQVTVGEAGPCTGDCDGDDMVAINELIIGVNIALGSRPVSACPIFDAGSDGQVEINELISGVVNALNGCP
jgi:hypothetical protein